MLLCGVGTNYNTREKGLVHSGAVLGSGTVPSAGFRHVHEISGSRLPASCDSARVPRWLHYRLGTKVGQALGLGRWGMLSKRSNSPDCTCACCLPYMLCSKELLQSSPADVSSGNPFGHLQNCAKPGKPMDTALSDELGQ